MRTFDGRAVACNPELAEGEYVDDFFGGFYAAPVVREDKCNDDCFTYLYRLSETFQRLLAISILYADVSNER